MDALAESGWVVTTWQRRGATAQPADLTGICVLCWREPAELLVVAADEVRPGDQSQDREANRISNSVQCLS
jgi:hypothetical protein